MTTKATLLTTLALLLLTLLAGAFLGGCSSAHRGNLTMSGEQTHAVLAQSFKQAYISSGKGGEFDVILVDQSAPKPPPRPLGAALKDALKNPFREVKPDPLQPDAAAQLKQVVHIHVFWQAGGGSVAKDGVVTNAAIDWYVIGHESSDRSEVLHYEGAGYVMLDEGKNSTKVEIRDGTLRRAELRGALQDPIGPSKLVGRVDAQRNTQAVRDYIDSLRDNKAAARTALSKAQ